MLIERLVLAVQNMEASCAVSQTQEIEFMALGGSLVMMSKGKAILVRFLQLTNYSAVLNDMLDLFE